jgi:hypothetical protein
MNVLVAGTWEGIWGAFSPGWEYGMTLKFDVKDGVVTGTNQWKLLQYPEGVGENYGSGKIATEFLSGKMLGTDDADEPKLELQGTSKDDPDNIIALHSYRLTISWDGSSLCGQTDPYVSQPQPLYRKMNAQCRSDVELVKSDDFFSQVVFPSSSRWLALNQRNQDSVQRKGFKSSSLSEERIPFQGMKSRILSSRRNQIKES